MLSVNTPLSSALAVMYAFGCSVLVLFLSDVPVDAFGSGFRLPLGLGKVGCCVGSGCFLKKDTGCR